MSDSISPLADDSRWSPRNQNGAASSSLARLIFNVVALTVLLLSLAGILFSFTDQLGDRLLLTGYVSPDRTTEFRPLPYLNADLSAFESVSGFLNSPADGSEPIANLQTADDFERLFTEILPSMQQPTLVLAIRCHSVTTAAGTFLQPQDADPNRPESGIDIRRLLDAVAAASAKNKLLLLDLVPATTNLRLGIACHNATRSVEQEFVNLTNSGIDLGNLKLILSTDVGQSSGSSFECGHSIFSLLAAYCLDGGPEADDAGKADGILTADEMSGFIEHAVADWSTQHRGRLQRPRLFSSGFDFPVAGVSEFMTLESWLAAPEADESDSEEDSSEDKDGNTGDGGKSDHEPPKPSADTVLAQIGKLWETRANAANSDVPIRRPRHWLMISQHLQQVERYVLAADPVAAQKQIDTYLLPLIKELEEPMTKMVRFPWTAPIASAEASEYKSAAESLQLALSEPTARHINQIADNPFIESALVRQLAPALRDAENLWKDPELLTNALSLRRLAEQTGHLSTHGNASVNAASPWLLPIVKSRIEDADRLRLIAEHSLTRNRTAEAIDQLRKARQAYEDIQDDADLLAADIQKIHLTALQIVDVFEWLLNSPNDPRTTETLHLVKSILRGMTQLAREPHEELVPPLLTLIHELDRHIDKAAHDAVTQPNSEGRLAVLLLPNLDLRLRLQILDRLMKTRDCPELHPSAEEFRPATINQCKMVSSSLSELVAAMGLRVNLKVDDDPVRTGTELRRVLAELREDPVLTPSDSATTTWGSFVQHLLRTPLQTELLRSTRFKPVATDHLVARLTIDHLSWQLDRLSRGEAAVPGDYSGPRNQIVRNLRELDPEYDSESPGGSNVRIRLVSSRLADDGRFAELRYEVAADIRMPEAESTELVIDWTDRSNEFNVVSLTNSSSGLVRKPVSDVIQTDSDSDRTTLRLSVGRIDYEPIEVVLRMTGIDGTADRLAQSSPDPLTAWIESGDKQRWATPLDLSITNDGSRDFEILVAAHDQQLGQSLDMFANETIPLSLSVLTRRPKPSDLMIKLTSDGEDLAWPITATPGQPVPVTVPEVGKLKIVGGDLTLQLVEAGVVVHEQSMNVGVANPASAFSSEVKFDPKERKLQAVVQRLLASKAETPVKLSMRVVGAAVEEAKLQGALAPEDLQAVIDATLAEDPDVTKFVVHIGVAGVPAVFSFHIDALTGRVRPRVKNQIRLASPRDHDVFALGDSDTLDVKLEVESSRVCEVHIGIDRNRNDYLEAKERLTGGRYWRGKVVKTSLEIVESELKLISRVNEPTFSISTDGLTGRQKLIAQLLAGGQTLNTLSTVYFVENVPSLSIKSPKDQQRIAFGQPVSFTVATDAEMFRTIEDVEVGVDRNENGKWDDDETIVPAKPQGEGVLRFDGKNVTSGEFDSAEFVENESEDNEDEKAIRKAESVLLMARPVQRVGIGQEDSERSTRTGKIQRRVIVIVDPSELPPPTGTITGVVKTADGLGQRNVTVTVGDRKTTTENDGSFRIPDVPIGPQKVVCDTPRRTGSGDVTVQAGKVANVDVELILR